MSVPKPSFDFFDNVDATVAQVSPVFIVGCFQDMRYLIQTEKTGTDGDPRIFLEESVRGVIWTPMENYKTCLDYYDIVNAIDSIKDSYFMGFQMRLRLEPNTNTTGTFSAHMGYKTKV